MSKVKRFSNKLLCKIEDLHVNGYFVSEISRKLHISVNDVKKGLEKIYPDEEP